MNGTYLLSFFGNASLTFPVSSVNLVTQTYNALTGVTEATLDVPITTNGQLWIGFHGAAMLGGGEGAKNISLLQPGCAEGSSPNSFAPAFLELVSRFDSLRFMDWASTNNNLESEWSDRRLPTAPSYAATINVTAGVAWETCIDLANAVGRDIWVNIPGEERVAQKPFLHGCMCLGLLQPTPRTTMSRSSQSSFLIERTPLSSSTMSIRMRCGTGNSSRPHTIFK